MAVVVFDQSYIHVVNGWMEVRSRKQLNPINRGRARGFHRRFYSYRSSSERRDSAPNRVYDCIHGELLVDSCLACLMLDEAAVPDDWQASASTVIVLCVL